MEKVADTFADRLRRARKKKGISQAELAVAIGSSQSTIGMMESGAVNSSKYLEAIAKHLDVPIQWLVYAQGSMGGGFDNKIPILRWENAPNWQSDNEPVDFLGVGIANSGTMYALKVENDLMLPEFPAGTIIALDGEKKPANGDFAVFHDGKGGNIRFRQYIQDGDNIWLKPLNPTYPITKAAEGTQICGVVVVAIRYF